MKLFGKVEKQTAEADLEDFAETDPQLRQLAAEPAVSAAYYGATALWQQNMADPSQELAARAVQAQLAFVDQHADSPLAADVNLRMGDYEFRVLDRFPLAARYYRKALEGRSSMDQQRAAIYQLLQCYTKLNEYDRAHRTALRLLREYPRHPKTRDVELQIGALLQEMGQNLEAIAYLRRVLEWAEGESPAAEAEKVDKAAEEATEEAEQLSEPESEQKTDGT